MHILVDYGLKYRNVKVMCENISITNLMKNPVHYFGNKHIKVKHHFIKNHVSKGDIKLNHVESKSNLIDIFTKSLPKNEFTTWEGSLSCAT